WGSGRVRRRWGQNGARCTRRKSGGHHLCLPSSLSVNMLTVTASPTCAIDSSCHAAVRTNPCAGAAALSALPANQGKQIGTPPRIASPCFQRDCELRKSTSSPPAGVQEVTCAP